MDNTKVSNPNDFKVVDFQNTTNFDFTPEMGCMYDSRPISGLSGKLGIVAGEKMTLPYHVGRRLSINLAKMVMVQSDDGKPQLDAHGQPMVKAIWGEERIEEVSKSFIHELYAEAKPIAQSETDKLMEKVEEYKKMVEAILPQAAVPTKVVEPVTESVDSITPAVQAPNGKVVYQDKAEVIAELEKRGVQHDKRKAKAELEKLLN